MSNVIEDRSWTIPEYYTDSKHDILDTVCEGDEIVITRPSGEIIVGRAFVDADRISILDNYGEFTTIRFSDGYLPAWVTDVKVYH